jgi:hypothetical protein
MGADCRATVARGTRKDLTLTLHGPNFGGAPRRELVRSKTVKRWILAQSVVRPEPSLVETNPIDADNIRMVGKLGQQFAHGGSSIQGRGGSFAAKLDDRLKVSDTNQWRLSVREVSMRPDGRGTTTWGRTGGRHGCTYVQGNRPCEGRVAGGDWANLRLRHHGGALHSDLRLADLCPSGRDPFTGWKDDEGRSQRDREHQLDDLVRDKWLAVREDQDPTIDNQTSKATDERL